LQLNFRKCVVLGQSTPEGLGSSRITEYTFLVAGYDADAQRSDEDISDAGHYITTKEVVRRERAISLAPGKMNILLAWLDAIVRPSNSTFFAGLPPAKMALPPAKSVIAQH